MAMLAEPRRKQRIGPNPRGKFFTEDEDNRGRNMLQKMGWSNGDGLGVERQGIREPIRPKIQTDSKGLGFDIKTDPWVSHNDDFNEVLKNLQAANGVVCEAVEEEEVDDGAARGFGFKPKETKSKNLKHVDLEINSKSSKSRIHYHKFVKNKDLSKIKTEDWNGIFGKPVNELGIRKSTEQQPEEADGGVDKFSSDLFINRGSLADYFKYKRAQKFVKPQNLIEDVKQKAWEEWMASENGEGEPEVSEPPNKKKREDDEEKTVSRDDAMEEEQVQVPKKKKKKKDKNVQQEEHDEILEQEVLEIPKKKKKKKNKSIQEDNGGEGSEVSTNIIKDVVEELPPKKKKKKDKSKTIQDDNSTCTSNDVIEEEVLDTPRKKKKKVKSMEPELSQEERTGAQQSSSELLVVTETEDMKAALESETPKKKNKKSKKIAEEDVDVDTKSVDTPEQEKVEVSEKFVNRGSMEDYFKSKMANRLQNLQSQTQKPQSLEHLCDQVIEPEQAEPAKSEKKRNKKAKQLIVDDTPEGQEVLAISEIPETQEKSNLIEDDEKQNITETTEEIQDQKKPTKKKKDKKVPEPAEDTIVADTQDEANCEKDKTLKVSDDGIVDATKGNFKKQMLTAEEYHGAAKEFSGSNLLEIPGYRNQSSKFI